MKIGIHTPDKKFPNLALMKLSAYHKAKGDSVSWYEPLFNHADIIYSSKVFNYSHDDPYLPPDAIKGGTGYDLKNKLSDEIDRMCPDYSIYPFNDKSYGYLTRGCPNKCSWCIVPEKEGGIRAYMDIDDILCGKKKVVLMDNNVLAHDHGLEQIEKMIRLGIKVDFNQGLDARIIADNSDIAELLSKLRWLKPLRMACDTKSQMKHIEKATSLLRKFGTTPSNYFVYVLVKDIPDALERVNFLKKLKLDPFAQPYRDFDNNILPSVEQKRFARWVNHKAIFKTVEYKNYVP